MSEPILFTPKPLTAGEKRIMTLQFHRLIPEGVAIVGSPVVTANPNTDITISGISVNGTDVSFFVAVADPAVGPRIVEIKGKATLSDTQEVVCEDDDGNVPTIEIV